MTEEKEFTKVHAEKPVARKIKAIAAMQGKHVYQVVEEMLEVYEAASVETLPTVKGGKKVKLVKAVRSH
jgi:hypothetical protein